MSKKFTEEQYQKIVDAWEETYDYVLSVKNVIETVESFGEVYELQIGEALALANAVSTEWAHEQFVEKEKRYVWHSNKNNVLGKSLRLFKDAFQAVRAFPANQSDKVTKDEHLTESEIREWGYNPEMFDREEV